MTVSGSEKLHGLVHVDGSSTVTVHSSDVFEVGVKRSINLNVAGLPLR